METMVATAANAASQKADHRAGKYLTFQLGNEEFAIQVLRVREIMGIQEITAVPQTPDYVKGVINLRGKVIPVVDLRLKFGLAGDRIHAAHLHHRGCRSRIGAAEAADRHHRRRGSEVLTLQTSRHRGHAGFRQRGGDPLSAGHGQDQRQGKNPAGHRHGSDGPGSDEPGAAGSLRSTAMPQRSESDKR